MAKVEEVDGKKVLVLSEHEYSRAGLDASKELEIEKAGQGTWVLKQRKEEEREEAEKKIAEKISRQSLSERVEGRFEKGLDEEEKKALAKMVESGEVIKFKLNPSYKKAVYKMREEVDGRSGARAGSGNYTGAAAGLEKQGYMQVKNELLVKKICGEIKEDIEEGRVIGIRGFDSHFNIIKAEVYEKYRNAMEKLLEEGGELRMEDISLFLGIDTGLARCVLEFLKEEGLVIEKKKDLFQLVP